MIIILGLLDLATILVTLSAVYYSVYADIAFILLILLGLKGVWTMIMSKNSPFFYLGLLDLAAALSATLTIQHCVLTQLTGLLLAIIGVKSFTSFIR